ncbi:phage minor head protein [Tranquillimonas rosea]|uniref:phage minor head protein n=1 Tax=Tranquillimonas rosea TaxID=641238 RepID=UPI003BAA9A60
MARDSRAAYLRALEQVSPQLRQAFEEAVQNARNAIVARVLEEAIARGDIQFATDILSRQEYFKAPLDQSIVEIFNAGGAYQASLVPKRRTNTAPMMQARFDVLNDRGINTARRLAGDLITEITEDTRTTIRETITAGLEANRPYRSIRRDLIGTRQGNQMRGGALGLHSRQAQAVRAARQELESGNYGAYLARSGEVRDKRFDKMIRRAREEGRSLSADDVDKITARYADGMLRHRARMIVRTEGHKAMQAGRSEATQQMIDDGRIRPELITKRWVATVGKHTRDHHLALNGTTVGWNEKFISPKTGFAMDRPHDPDAPPVDTVGCRCVLITEIDFLAMAE